MEKIGCMNKETNEEFFEKVQESRIATMEALMD